MTRIRLFSTPTFRLILLSSAIFGVSAIIMFGVMYMAVTRAMSRQMDAELQNEIISLSDNDGRMDRDRLIARVQGRISRHSRTGTYYLVEDEDGSLLAGNLPKMPAPFHGAYDLPSPLGVPEHELRAAGISLPNGLNLLIARDAYVLDEVADLMERTFGVGVMLTLVAALSSGVLISRRLLQRLETINRTSQEIMSGAFGRRIPVQGYDQAFEELTTNLNNMLARIEELMEGVRQVSDNIAHDMRTPLTRLRNYLEQVRLSGATVEEFRNAVDIALLSTDDLLEMFGALLRIAQIEARTPCSGLEPIDLSALCEMVAETYGPVAESEGHRLTSAIVPGLSVAGDKQLLTQMLVNLVENALQHNRTPIEVRILLSQPGEGGGPLLTVADNGVGIAAEERANVLRRFYRTDASRSSQGSGLGLSLAEAIAKYHGAALILEDNEPGLRLLLRFPTRRPYPHH